MKGNRYKQFATRWLMGCAVGLAGQATSQAGSASPPPSASDHSLQDNRVWIRLPRPEFEYDWTRHFRVGMLTGFNIKANFSMNGSFNISGGGRPGFYDDGYVVPSGNAFGTTSDWGYDSASQYEPSTHTLTMHRATAFSTTGNGNASSEDAPYLGFDLAYGDTIHDWGRTRLGWEFGFGLLPLAIQDNQTLSAEITRVTYSFNTGGINLPTPGYRGGPDGGPNIYSASTGSADQYIPGGTVSGSRTLDVTLYSMRLGPSFYWDLHRRLGLSVGGGPAIGVVSGSLKFDETITPPPGEGSSAHNTGRIGATDLVFGGYANATLMYHAVEGGDIYLGVQYMPLGKTSISGENRRAELDLSGQVYIFAGINWPF